MRKEKRSTKWKVGGAVGAAAVISALLIYDAGSPQEEAADPAGGESGAQETSEEEAEAAHAEEETESAEPQEDTAEPSGPDEPQKEPAESEEPVRVKPTFEKLDFEDSGASSFTVEFTQQENSWQETYVPFSPELIPVEGYIPEGWEVTEIEEAEDGVPDRVSIEGTLMVEYFEPEATAEDVEAHFDHLFDGGYIFEEEITTLSEDEFPELEGGLPEDFIETGYIFEVAGEFYFELYYGQLNGRYLSIFNQNAHYESELWGHGDVFLNVLSPAE
ncbi:hypothetical protein [Alkalicoccus urumqiensis]|uniref:Uncharacterized protein n=1 Tax=Alkalicoccus urumqiensis TaxID=1548213 RepID=A0A2P6MHF9_ALKUR|nr:hypothetical protein [Alkalicoccus urumqiensis]PRO65722.1 hypothetical protein C6I21_07425 [Alkalicoccus urumqiensis]